MQFAERGKSSGPVARGGGLSDTEAKNAKAADKRYKLFDAAGLYLLVNPNGSKLWRLKYRFGGRERLLAIGRYGPGGVSLKEARARRDDARRLLRDGVDPVEVRREQKAEAARRAANSFETIATEWIAKNEEAWGKSHRERVRKFLSSELFPKIGRRPLDAINAPELLAAIEAIAQRGALETAKKTLQYAAAVFDYAQVTRGILGNPARALRGALTHRPPRRYRFLTRDELGPFLVKLGAYSNRQTAIALKLSLLTAVRPGELRKARWNEFDICAKGGALWRIPAERMKSGTQHIVPLSKQAVEGLHGLASLNGSAPTALLFPSLTSRSTPISENTMTFAIRRMGFAAASHGARHTFSTIAHEDDMARSDVIAACLGHKIPGMRGVYSTAQYLPERRKLLQQWADLLDQLESAQRRR